MVFSGLDLEVRVFEKFWIGFLGGELGGLEDFSVMLCLSLIYHLNLRFLVT